VTNAIVGGRGTEADSRFSGRRWWWLAAILVVAFGASSFAPRLVNTSGGGPLLVVIDEATRQPIVSRPVVHGEQIRLEHVHSVTGRRIEEVFVVLDDQRLGMVSLAFDRHGANLPTGPEVVGGRSTTYIEKADGSILVLHHDRPLPAIGMVVGSPSVDHVLIFEDGDRVRLLDVAEQWSHIEIKVTASP